MLKIFKKMLILILLNAGEPVDAHLWTVNISVSYPYIRRSVRMQRASVRLHSDFTSLATF